MAAPYPGTELYREALANGWLTNGRLVSDGGTQVSALSCPHLSHTEIFGSVEEFYRRFYFRPRKIFSMIGSTLTDPGLLRRRLREGVEFFQFLYRRTGEDRSQSL